MTFDFRSKKSFFDVYLLAALFFDVEAPFGHTVTAASPEPNHHMWKWASCSL